MVVYYVLLLFSVASVCETNGCRKLVIDHDGGADDAMAIFLALLYEQYFDGPAVIALTTTHGNVDEPQVFENSQRILDIAQRRDVPIYRGSNFSLVSTYPSDYYFGKDGLGDLPNVEYQPIDAQRQHAVNALIELSKEYKEELTIVALGSLTNIALAIRLDPQFIGRLGQLYAAAGNTHDTKPVYPEFNAKIDVEGYYVVMQNSMPEKVTLIFSHLLDRTIPMEWRKNVLGAIDTPIMQAQNQFERIADANSSTWKFLDPQAMALALNQSLVISYICDYNTITLCGDKRGIDTNNFTDCKESNVKVAYPPAKYPMMDFLYNVFSASCH